MRGTLLVSAALFAGAVAALALAQTPSTPPTPGSSDTVAPASPNTESVTDKPAESGSGAAQGTAGGPGDTGATAPGPASSSMSGGPATGATAPGPGSSGSSNGTPAPGGTTKELTTGRPTNKNPDHGSVTSETRSQRHVTQPSKSEAKQANNIARSHHPTRPHPPASSADENASADQYLRDAQAALRGHRTGEAQEALERAETQALNSAPEGKLGQNSTVDTIERAREAMGHVRYLRPDPAQAGRLIDQALSQTVSSSTSSSQ